MLSKPAPRPNPDPASGGVSSSEPDPPALELELMERIRLGDTAAFDVLFTANYEPLLRFAYTYMRSRAAAEEVVQDVFLKFWAQRERCVIRETVRQYLFAATRNQALNRLRRGQLEYQWVTKAQQADGATTVVPRARLADEETRVAELDSAIRAAVDRLPKRCREAFLLSREHRFTYEQIAELMGISVKTVQEQIGRALRALRISLADWLV
jgi:RNA polymerase sigma-70 factor (family 1)